MIMKIGSTYKKVLLVLLLLVELFIYVSFLFLDFFNENFIVSSWLKYSGIIGCLLISFLAIISKKPAKPQYFFQISFIFTLISDYFLLINSNENNNLYGVSFFIIVQLIYFIYIEYIKKDKMSFLLSLSIRAVITILVIIILKFQNFDRLSILSACYFIELLMNFITSFGLIKMNKFYLIFTIGLLLFIGCDVSVGLYNLDILEAESKILVGNLMWTFYLPSQVLIAFSIFVDSRKNVYRI